MQGYSVKQIVPGLTRFSLLDVLLPYDNNALKIVSVKVCYV